MPPHDHPPTAYLQRLRFLSWAYFILGALHGLLTCLSFFPLYHGIAIFGGFDDGNYHPHGPPAELFGLVYLIFGGFVLLVGGLFTGLMFALGRFLPQHKHYTFCATASGILCCLIPVGTILGITTIATLRHAQVQELFGQNHTA